MLPRSLERDAKVWRSHSAGRDHVQVLGAAGMHQVGNRVLLPQQFADPRLQGQAEHCVNAAAQIKSTSTILRFVRARLIAIGWPGSSSFAPVALENHDRGTVRFRPYGGCGR